MKVGNLILSSDISGMIPLFLHAVQRWLLLVCAMGMLMMTRDKIQGSDRAMIGDFSSLLVWRPQLDSRIWYENEDGTVVSEWNLWSVYRGCRVQMPFAPQRARDGSLHFTVLTFYFEMEPLSSRGWWQILRSAGRDPLKGLEIPVSQPPHVSPDPHCQCAPTWCHPPPEAKQAGPPDLECELTNLFFLFK